MSCTVEGCGRNAMCRGLCRMHYRRRPEAIPRRDWSEWEKATITARYAEMGQIALSAILHGRSPKAIKVKAGSMGLAKRRVPGAEPADHAETMVGAALRMWKGPADRERPMRWSVVV